MAQGQILRWRKKLSSFSHSNNTEWRPGQRTQHW